MKIWASQRQKQVLFLLFFCRHILTDDGLRLAGRLVGCSALVGPLSKAVVPISHKNTGMERSGERIPTFHFKLVTAHDLWQTKRKFKLVKLEEIKESDLERGENNNIETWLQISGIPLDNYINMTTGKILLLYDNYLLKPNLLNQSRVAGADLLDNASDISKLLNSDWCSEELDVTFSQLSSVPFKAVTHTQKSLQNGSHLFVFNLRPTWS